MSTKPSCKTIQESLDLFREEQKSNQSQILKDLLEIKDTVIKHLLKENERLKERVKVLEDNTEEYQCNLIDVESQSQQLEQYTRRNNLEISGIPNTVSDKDLESKCISILNSVDIKASSDEIEACHRLPARNNQPKTTIIKFTNRKIVESACSKEKRIKLKNCNKIELGLPENTELYFNENLSPFYKHLSWMCRELKRKNYISGSWFRDGKLFFKYDEDSRPIRVLHQQDLYDEFPDVSFEQDY